MRLGSLRTAFDLPGPMLTACLDVSRNNESAAAEIELRWRALRDELADAGAPDAALDAAEERLLEVSTVPGDCGRCVVTTGSGVAEDHVLPGRRPQSAGRWGLLPHLLPVVEFESAQVAHVYVEVDRTGADISVHAPLGEWSESVEGSTHQISKVNAGGWSQGRYEQRAENLWERNASEVAQRVDVLVRTTGAELLVVAGETRAAQLLEDALAERSREILRSSSARGRADGVSPEALAQSREALLEEYATARARSAVAEFLEQRGRDERAAAGLQQTMAALAQAQVELLLLPEAWDPDAVAWFGSDATQVALDRASLDQLGVEQPHEAPVADVVLRAAAGTDARVLVVPAPLLDLGNEPAAVLRWADGGSA